MDKTDYVLIEDDQNDTELMLLSLEKLQRNFRYLHLKDGEKAMSYLDKLIKREEANPRLIILDLKIPKVSGLEVLKKLKNHIRTRQIPVVVFSSSKIIDLVEECYSCGSNAYVEKPIDFDKFQETVLRMGQFWLVENVHC